MYDSENIDQILTGLRNNDKEAYKALYQTGFPIVKKLVTSSGGTISDAEDVFTDAVLVLYRYLQREDFKMNSKVSTFLYAIAKNIWLKELSKKSKRVTASIDEFSLEELDNKIESPEVQISFDLDLETKSKIINESLNELGESCKNLLIQFYYEGKKIKDIAEEGNMTYAFLKKRLFDCKQRLVSIVQKKMNT